MGGVRRPRLLIALVQVLALSVWFSASAVVPALRQEWGLSAGAAVWLTASVQLGFVTGALTSTALNLPDRLPARPGRRCRCRCRGWRRCMPGSRLGSRGRSRGIG